MRNIYHPSIINKKTYVSNSPNKGRGLFASKDIRKNELIGFLRGNIIRFEPRNMKDSLVGEHWLYIKKHTWLDVKSQEKYINHSCVPNAGIVGSVSVRAMRDIKRDEEIKIDYSTLEEDENWSMNCHCGEKKCRKIIRSIQFLPKRMYNSYGNFIPTYLRNKYQDNV